MVNTNPDDFFTREPTINERDRALIEFYVESRTAVDQLAYTEEFDRLYERYINNGHKGEKRDVFRRLLSLRKAGLLPSFSRSLTGSFQIKNEETSA